MFLSLPVIGLSAMTFAVMHALWKALMNANMRRHRFTKHVSLASTFTGTVAICVAAAFVSAFEPRLLSHRVLLGMFTVVQIPGAVGLVLFGRDVHAGMKSLSGTVDPANLKRFFAIINGCCAVAALGNAPDVA